MPEPSMLLPPAARKRTGDPLAKCPICKLRPQGQEWFKAKNVARHFGYSERHFCRKIASGEIEGVRIGRPLLVSHDALDAWVESRSTFNED